MQKILVAGIGNKYMGDDGFGPRVVEALTTRDLPEDVEVRDVGLCGVTLAPDLDDYKFVIFVDAVKKGGKPGTIYRIEIGAGQIEKLKPEDARSSLPLSIHEAKLEELLLFAKAIGTLPSTIVVIGCEVVEVTLGEVLSQEVETAVHRAVELILKELQRYRERK
ncbi:MAG: hydrogenase maturation protease [Methanosarcinales archaeon Met12]|nr:MAG: hydrogenase maturation protease [Methanosarcinales archaeon Met12]